MFQIALALGFLQARSNRLYYFFGLFLLYFHFFVRFAFFSCQLLLIDLVYLLA